MGAFFEGVENTPLHAIAQKFRQAGHQGRIELVIDFKRDSR